MYRDGKRVLECLQRSLRVSDSVVDTAVSVELFVEVSVSVSNQKLRAVLRHGQRY
jgi:Vacuolar protein sorting-associated protein 35